LFVQIETPEGVSNASQILWIEGIDGLFIGNGDLVSFRSGGQPTPEVDRVVADLIVLAKRLLKHGYIVRVRPEKNTWFPGELRGDSLNEAVR
jgi:2-keto-3-deoxy-L-rhamnonate aldolase RhmA